MRDGTPDERGDGAERVRARTRPECGAGWHALIARLDERMTELLPGYEVLQVKEKFGTLRYYWSAPEPACCARMQRESEGMAAWRERVEEHLASSEHAAAEVELRERVARAEAFVREAESASARTCEACGAEGVLRRDRYWVRTRCDACHAGQDGASDELASLAEENERLRALVAELVPFMLEDVRNGLLLGPADPGHDDECEDCVWYARSVAWRDRVQRGEFPGCSLE